jgi:hypothetical protein
MLTAFSFNFAHIMVMEIRPLRHTLLAHFFALTDRSNPVAHHNTMSFCGCHWP